MGTFSVEPLTELCALRSTQPLKVSTRDFSWGKDGRCLWLTTNTLVVPKRQDIRGLNLTGTPWATSTCRGNPLLFYITFISNNTYFYLSGPGSNLGQVT